LRQREEAHQLIEVFDPLSPDKHNMHGVRPLNYASIAKVCDTDILTIQLLVKEIVAQMKHQLKAGAALRLQFKVGKLLSRAGQLEWRSFNSEESGAGGGGVDAASRMTSSYAGSKAMVYSVKRRELSTNTPSILGSRASSMRSSKPLSFHMANPNPQ